MTTLADREHAIEAFFAARELAAFRERSRRYRRLGLRLAGLTDFRGQEARRLALLLGRQCIEAPSDEAAYRRIEAEFARLGVSLSHEDIGRIAAGERDWSISTAPAPEPTWVEFVTGELLALFTPTAEAHEAPHPRPAPARDH